MNHLGFDMLLTQADQQNRDRVWECKAGHLPTDIDAGVDLYMTMIEQHHQAMMHGNFEQVLALRDQPDGLPHAFAILRAMSAPPRRHHRVLAFRVDHHYGARPHAKIGDDDGDAFAAARAAADIRVAVVFQADEFAFFGAPQPEIPGLERSDRAATAAIPLGRP